MDPTLLIVVCGVLAVVAIVTTVIVRRTRVADADYAPARSDRWAVGLIAAGALAAAGISLALGTINVVSVAQGPLVVDGMPLQHAADVDAPGAASTDAVAVTLPDAPTHVRVLAAFTAAMPAVTTLALALVTAGICVGVMRGRPFASRLPAAMVTAALVLMAGSLAHSMLTAFVHAEVAALLDADAAQPVFVPFTMDIDFTP